jgi:hypothetical protein
MVMAIPRVQYAAGMEVIQMTMGTLYVRVVDTSGVIMEMEGWYLVVGLIVPSVAQWPMKSKKLEVIQYIIDRIGTCMAKIR